MILRLGALVYEPGPVPISLYHDAQAFRAPERGTLVAIGNFDGVHRGHVAVLERAVALAAAQQLVPVVLTFDPHPAEVLGRGKLPQLTPLAFKAELIGRVSPALAVVVQHFTRELAQKSPAEFAAELLASKLAARVVMVGENFEFGRGRSGRFQDLVELGRELGFVAEAMQLAGDAGGTYSSSRVRKALGLANLREVACVLGRPHSLSGSVVHGQGRGQQLGVATANLGDVAEALPPNGVYAVFVEHLAASGPKVLGGGVANIGVRPTLAAGFSVEAHIFDFSQDLYGKSLRLHLLERLRDEQKFASLEELKVQIQRDIVQARHACVSAQLGSDSRD